MPDFRIDRRALLGAALAVSTMPAAAWAAEGQDAARALAAAINDPAARQPFLDRWASPAGLKRRPAEVWFADFERVRQMSGGVDFVAVGGEPRSVVAIVRTRRQGLLRQLVALCDRDAPDRVFRLVFSPRPTPYDQPLPTGPLAPAALLKAIERRVAFAARRDEFSGAVRIVSPDGKVFYEAAHGVANRDDDAKITVGSRFHLGSADKSFTALLIGRHIAAGRLSLDTPVADVLPTWANREAGAKITVRRLLNHTSGLGDLWSRPTYDKRKPNTTVTELLPAFSDAVPSFEPGTRQAYSNEGYVALGAVVEAVGGKSWYDQLAEQIYAPAGMSHSGHFTLEDVVPGRVVGYRFSDDDLIGIGQRRPNTAFHGWRGNSCGGGYSTVADMAAYLRALRAGKLASRAIYDQFTVQSEGGLPEYGLGFAVRPVGGRTAIGHGGGGPGSGVDGDSWVIKETGWACSILGNYDAPFVQDLSRDIRAMVAAQKG